MVATLQATQHRNVVQAFSSLPVSPGSRDTGSEAPVFLQVPLLIYGLIATNYSNDKVNTEHTHRSYCIRAEAQ